MQDKEFVNIPKEHFVQDVETSRTAGSDRSTVDGRPSTESFNSAGDTLKRNNLPYLLAGIFFGILMVKSEVISWFRIQEMFRFESIHMYGIMGSAVAVGMTSVYLIKKFNIKTIHKEKITVDTKPFSKGQIYGGVLFGFGWAITGACPGPIFAQIGTGATVVIITLLSAIAGTWTYGFIRHRLPH
jgi:uncharacterized protein